MNPARAEQPASNRDYAIRGRSERSAATTAGLCSRSRGRRSWPRRLAYLRSCLSGLCFWWLGLALWRLAQELDDVVVA
jgi:hypothetical protein